MRFLIMKIRDNFSGWHSKLSEQVSEPSGLHSELSEQVSEPSGWHSEISEHVSEPSGRHSKLSEQVSEPSGRHSKLSESKKVHFLSLFNDLSPAFAEKHLFRNTPLLYTCRGERWKFGV